MVMKPDLKEHLAVVTGGSRGIGRFIAEALLAEGARVVITGRDQRALQSAADEMGANIRPIVCDQRDPERIQAMAEEVLSQEGTPDLLINNAGAGAWKPVVELSLEDWNRTIESYLTGVFLTTKAFLPAMIRKNRADIFMISSMSGKSGDPGSSAYNAAKFGLQGFSQALAKEVRRNNIRVMVLNPSSVDKSPDTGPSEGPGLYLHAADLADTIVHLAKLPGRTLIRDMDIWGTHPS